MVNAGRTHNSAQVLEQHEIVRYNLRASLVLFLYLLQLVANVYTKRRWCIVYGWQGGFHLGQEIAFYIGI